MVKRTAADPLVVAAAIIERQGRYLITQRLHSARHGGLWEFPGGKCEAGETLEACLARELQEELDVQVAIKGLERVVRHDEDDGPVELHFYRCELTAGEPRLLGCLALCWVLPHELAGFTFPPANRPLVDALASIKSTQAQSSP
jgi:8-oxo-dGTP diphosphatase